MVNVNSKFRVLRLMGTYFSISTNESQHDNRLYLAPALCHNLGGSNVDVIVTPYEGSFQTLSFRNLDNPMTVPTPVKTATEVEFTRIKSPESIQSIDLLTPIRYFFERQPRFLMQGDLIAIPVVKRKI